MTIRPDERLDLSDYPPDRQRCCGTCKHWQSVEKDDVAGCECPIPEWVDNVLDWEDIDRNNGIAGDQGVDCPCWEVGP